MEAYQSAASCVVVMLGLCQIKCSGVEDSLSPSRVTVTASTALTNLFLLGYCGLLVYWFELREVVFPMAVLFSISLFLPYLRKSSKYRNKSIGLASRSWSDRLVVTSGAYGVSALFAAYQAQWWLACVCAVTCTGSTVYHLNREMLFFNMDNVFATSLLMVFVYTLLHAHSHHEVYFLLGLLGLPVAGFLIVFCGMPALIRPPKTTNTDTGKYTDTDKETDKLGWICCPTREGRELYDSVHTLWHLASAMGPLLSVWYIGHVYQEIQHDLTLPCVSLLLSVAINICANLCGVMPMD
ncbi:hypothetical protein B484DRAFT_395643 [Ochromonadaceae sp. CCMP2298]|nr:hypothetical protein B484DRAFT_395643 [Ochromonadaceae sp. CCMP2298]